MTGRRVLLLVGLVAAGVLAALTWGRRADRVDAAPSVPASPETAAPMAEAPTPPPAPPTPAPTEAAPADRAPRDPSPTPRRPPPPQAPPPQPADAAGSRLMAERLATDETRLMTKIRSVVKSNPEQALVLIDAADRAHPNGASGEERAALKIDALVNAGRIGRARDSAEQYLRRYPSGQYAGHVERLTGVHPRPSGPE